MTQALELFGHVGFEGLGARVYGWLTLTVAAGADLPLVAARSFQGHEPPEPVVARPGEEMRWIVGELNRPAEALHPNVSLPLGVRRRDVFRQARPLWRPRMHYDGVRFGDRAPLRTLAARLLEAV